LGFLDVGKREQPSSLTSGPHGGAPSFPLQDAPFLQPSQRGIEVDGAYSVALDFVDGE